MVKNFSINNNKKLEFSVKNKLFYLKFSEFIIY